MADEQGNKLDREMTVTEKLRQLRAEAAAKAGLPSILHSDLSLPSPVPASQASPDGDISEDIPLMGSTALPLNESDIQIEPLEDGALCLPSKPMEYFILLPMVSMVRDVYQATMYSARDEIEAFSKSNATNTAVSSSIDTMIETLDLISDHQDLMNDSSLTQTVVPDDFQARWAENCSTKCLFLRQLLDALRGAEIHIAILTRPGKMLSILESMLKANQYIFNRPDRPTCSSSNAVGPLKITLLPTGMEGGCHVVDRADAVIAFDSTFRVSERYSKTLRTHLIEPERMSPLISLVVRNSVEHLQLCLLGIRDPLERKLALVNCIFQVREDVGVLDPGMPSPDQAALAVADYISGSATDNVEWPLPPNPAIIGLQILSEPQAHQSSSSMSQSYPTELSALTHAQTSMKRHLKPEEDYGLSKRTKMSPFEATSSSGEFTHVSDTVEQQPQNGSMSTGPSFNQAIAHTSGTGDQNTQQVNSLLSKVSDLKTRLQAQEAIESRLRHGIKTLESHLEDRVSAIRKIQPKYQETLNERAKFQAERDAAIAQAKLMTERMETRLGDIAKLKEEKVTLMRELSELQNLITSSAIPEIVELERLREEVKHSKAEKEKIEKRMGSLSRDFEFTRDSYQKASTSAVDLANELTEARLEISILQRKADENSLRIAEIQRDSELQQKGERISELELLLADREMELWRKGEELKAKTNGRRETRGTSVPRSPHLVSGAMSPRRMPIGVGNGSRQNSPAPGEMPRIREGFGGDATLFPSRQWNHLREG
ncbi:MAG: hypothetical protein M1818_008424 [Claussenomyces sp. TS43310]|nr:MAG: hypothetical protein M1818_008424 [Claussenomyces sp. TS43310]